jgi:hypothetical protein
MTSHHVMVRKKILSTCRTLYARSNPSTPCDSPIGLRCCDSGSLCAGLMTLLSHSIERGVRLYAGASRMRAATSLCIQRDRGWRCGA